MMPQSHDGNIPSRKNLRGWIHAARRGDEAAFGQLAHWCRQYLLNVANEELTGDVAIKVAPSDVVQETLFEAHRDIGGFRGGSPEELRGWLRKILLHNIADAVRDYRVRQKRNVAREVRLDEACADSDDGFDLPEDTDGPVERAEARELGLQLSNALASLPIHYRKVIELRNRDRLGFAEIGERLQRTEDGARKLWARAIDRLRRELTTDE